MDNLRPCPDASQPEQGRRPPRSRCSSSHRRNDAATSGVTDCPSHTADGASTPSARFGCFAKKFSWPKGRLTRKTFSNHKLSCPLGRLHPDHQSLISKTRSKSLLFGPNHSSTHQLELQSLQGEIASEPLSRIVPGMRRNKPIPLLLFVKQLTFHPGQESRRTEKWQQLSSEWAKMS